MRIAILAAFEDELTDIHHIFPELRETIIGKRRCFVTKFNGHEILISLMGVGTISAASATTAICERFEPDFILVSGVAGGLDSQNKVGDLILAKKIVDIDMLGFEEICQGTPYEANCLTDPHTLKKTTNEYEVNKLILNMCVSISLDGLLSGNIASSNIFPAPLNLMNKIRDMGCTAIEMESAGVFKAASYYDTPVLTIRAISNTLSKDGNDSGTTPDAIKLCSSRLRAFLTEFVKLIPTLEKTLGSQIHKKIDGIIKKYGLIEHPEGGWFCEKFRSKDIVRAQGISSLRYFNQDRIAGSSIIYLLAENNFSGWHTVQSDETWNFHDGDAFVLRIIDPKTEKLEEITIGSQTNNIQFTVKAGQVFCAETTGCYSLVGCMVTPGFEYKDFKLITKQEFQTKFPQFSKLTRLAREKETVEYNCTVSF